MIFILSEEKSLAKQKSEQRMRQQYIDKISDMTGARIQPRIEVNRTLNRSVKLKVEFCGQLPAEVINEVTYLVNKYFPTYGTEFFHAAESVKIITI